MPMQQMRRICDLYTIFSSRVWLDKSHNLYCYIKNICLRSSAMRQQRFS